MSTDHTVQDLTKNQSLVMNVLNEAQGRLSAYGILDTLRPQGFRAPPQVYRALEQLIKLGLVHKLESLNAYIACQHDDCSKHRTVAFTICDACEDVTELSDDALVSGITGLVANGEFEVQRSMVELHGVCENCKAQN